MAIREALMALLEQGPASDYQLKRRFERTTSSIWPLNMGQVSTTLQRLHRDGLIEQVDGSEHDVPDDSDSRSDSPVAWLLTAAGHAEVSQWWRAPVLPEQRGRDELVMKLAFAVVTPGVDVSTLVQRQRVSMQQLLHDVTRARRQTDGDDLDARLVLDHRIFITEAELRWLETLDEAQLRIARTHRASRRCQPPLPSRKISPMRERSFVLPAGFDLGSAMISLPFPSDGLRVIGFCFRMLVRCGGCTPSFL